MQTDSNILELSKHNGCDRAEEQGHVRFERPFRKTAREHYKQLLADPSYRSMVASCRDSKTLWLGRLLVLNPLAGALWDSDSLGLPAREADLCLALVLVDLGCEPREVAELIWWRPGGLAEQKGKGAQYITQLVLSSYALVASGEEARDEALSLERQRYRARSIAGTQCADTRGQERLQE